MKRGRKKKTDIDGGDDKATKIKISDDATDLSSSAPTPNITVDEHLDPKIAKNVHVYSDNGLLYHATLNQTDLDNNNNKFFICQLLENQKSKKYYCFFRWGRVGVKGQSMLHEGTLDAMLATFNKKFKEKNGGVFGNPPYPSKEGKYTYIEVLDTAEDREVEIKKLDIELAPVKDLSTEDASLEPRLRNLIKLIFDIQKLTKSGIFEGFDFNKCPLGKLSDSMVLEAYTVLSDIADVLYNGKKGNLKQLSSRFYTLIPHNFGFQKMINFIIDTPEKLKSKLELLQSLSDIKITHNLISTLQGGGTVDSKSLSGCYAQLKCGLTALDPTEDDYQMCHNFLMTTHGSTHDYFNCELIDVFRINRQDEELNFNPNNYDNLQLLWHGSRLSNFVGILSQGLRIAPPEAPVNGYMFGKGVYLADVSSKSAGYCYFDEENDVGILLLCQAALGKMRILHNADYNANNPKDGCISTKGCGQMVPNPKTHFMFEDDTLVPCGKIIKTKDKDCSLFYNEYIVYNTNQIRLRFLLKVRFKYKK